MSVLVNTQGPVQSKAWGLAYAGYRVLSSGLMGLVCMNFVVYFADYIQVPTKLCGRLLGLSAASSATLQLF